MHKSPESENPYPSSTDCIADVRRKNELYRSEDAHDTSEAARLKKQGELLKKIGSNTYKKILSAGSDLSILDIGCNDGSVLLDCLSGYSVKNVIGIDVDSDAVSRANASYSNDSRHFYHLDCEDPDFSSNLNKIMCGNGIDGFDVVILSMVILHLEDPFKVLKILKTVLKSGGKIIIRDVDDGLFFAYPDEDGAFKRLMHICSYCEATGYRQSGRQIYSLLKRIGMKNICLDVCGWNSVGMDEEEKDAFFDVWASFIPRYLKLMVNKYPDNKEIADDYKWLTSVYDDLEKRFIREDFIYQCGIMIYTAEK